VHAVSAKNPLFLVAFSVLDVTLTALGRENTFIIDQPLHPAHHVIDISRRGEGYGSFVLIRPGKVQPVWSRTKGNDMSWVSFRAQEKEAGRRKSVLFRSAHLAARLDGTEFRDDIVKVVQVLVKVKDCPSESSISTVPQISSPSPQDLVK
jgi:hypothetical protein